MNWRPSELVGGLEGYRARRFCGVLNLDMLEANHQKDGFAWDLFDRDDLLKALKQSKLVKGYLDEANKAVGRKMGPPQHRLRQASRAGWTQTRSRRH